MFQHACRMIRKIFEARDTMMQIQDQAAIRKTLIRQTYLHLLGDQPRIPWKALMFSNDARPRAKFTMWLHMHERLLTTDRLTKWDINMQIKCSLCQEQNETNEHIFVQFRFPRKVWESVMT